MTSFAFRRAPLRLPSQSALAQVGGKLLIATIAANMTVIADDKRVRRGADIALCAAMLLWFAATRRTSLTLALLMVYLRALNGYLKLASSVKTVKVMRDTLLFAIVIKLL